MIRRRKKVQVSLPEITLTPLIDTALNLLIIFMITTPMLQNSIKVDLPEGQSKEMAGAKEEMGVELDKNQKLTFNGIPVTMNNLVPTIQKAVEKDSNRTVFVKAHRDVPYGKVIEMVDQIKFVGGIKYVALATKKAV